MADSTPETPEYIQQPSYNSDGQQVWNPSVGRYFEPAANQRESYGGIVGALQDQLVSETGVAKAYPHNFAGIIAAIEDLTFTQKAPPSKPDVKPPGGEAVPDGEGGYDWIWIEPPADGSLWFDERQGRLFIAIGGQYYQTNGADGLAQVTTGSEQPDSPVVGQFWWDVDTKSLYIFDGFWRAPDGSIKDNFQPGYTPVWRLVVTDDGAFAATTTATLPLALNRTTAETGGNILPELNPDNTHVQQDFNQWLFDSLLAVQTSVESGEYSSVSIEAGATAPADPSEGDLWFNSSASDLSIYYNGQWVPTTVTYTYDTQIADLNSQLGAEQSARFTAISALHSKVDGLIADSTTIQDIQEALGEVEIDLASRPLIDPSQFATTDATDALTTRVAALEGAAPDYALLMSRAEIEGGLDALQASIAALPTQAAVDAVAATVPDVSSFVTQQDINTSINNITVDYLPRSGGAVTGSFVVEKTGYDEPAFDFSGASWHSAKAFKFFSNGPVPATATFGTTNKAWEFAWNFDEDEDFCWVHENRTKVFSVTKDGPAASTIYLGDFQENDEYGRVMSNKIDVKERLTRYQSAFEQLRQSVANATDYNSLRANILSALSNV